jgi:hypothetical protein
MDAHFASQFGTERFFDIASRLAIPFTELGLLTGWLVSTASSTRDRYRTLGNLSAALWACAVVNLFMFLVIDHPLWFIGL